MTDLTTLDDHHIAPANDRLYFSLLKEQGEILANAMMVPAAYRGKSAEIIAAGMAGRAFGWDVMMSMRNFHVIQGTASLRPEAMLGLVYRAGHSVVITEEDGVAFAVLPINRIGSSSKRTCSNGEQLQIFAGSYFLTLF